MIYYHIHSITFAKSSSQSSTKHQNVFGKYLVDSHILHQELKVTRVTKNGS
ncbi:hypothetical protein L798_12348 [Zootermopsis nevadensis]|uniref:Uncharacterized protein n=1 Tax=Zootermopsis nevadensis TaxID=136037 RepID=A0A067QUE8_ZOONE|nr:hypothetical protein L798_12348 [Zootermopsis nevadensis]